MIMHGSKNKKNKKDQEKKVLKECLIAGDTLEYQSNSDPDHGFGVGCRYSGSENSYLDDDGVKIEPECYYPIIPMVLVNGAEGIGTGFSTSIPCYNPLDLVHNIYNKMNNKPLNELTPWYKNFNGKIIKIDNCTYDVYGNYEIMDENRIIIKELPLGLWTTPYKEFLEGIQYDSDSKKNVIVGFTDNNTDERVHFVITFPDNKLHLYQNNDTIEAKLKLVKKLKTSNMNLFNEEGTINTFNEINDIFNMWYDVRLKKYDERKSYLIGKISNELDLLKYKALFIKYVLEEKIIVLLPVPNQL